MDLDPELVAVAGEALRHLDAHALLDVVQDLLVAALIADQQQPQPVVLQHLQRLARHVRLGVARPRHAQLAQLARDRLRARQVVGEGVVVEEEFPHLREIAPRQRDLLRHMARRAHPVAMPAHRLRPQAERAARLAAAPGVERHVRMQQIADEVVLDAQVALVDLGDERQRVHVLEDRAVLVVHDPARTVAIRDAVDRRPVAALGDLLHREVELVARDEIDRRALAQAFVRLHRHLGADEADLQRRVRVLQRRRHLHVGRERRRRGMDHASS